MGPWEWDQEWGQGTGTGCSHPPQDPHPETPPDDADAGEDLGNLVRLSPN